MHKNKFFGIVAAFSLLFGSTIIHPLGELQQLENETTQPFAIAFDFDGVLFHALTKSEKTKVIFKMMSWRILIPAIKQLKRHGKGSLSTWSALCKKHGNYKGQRYLEEMINGKKVHSGTEKLIKRLHEKGYKLFRATNQGIAEVEMHTKRLPHILKCFTSGVDVHDQPGQPHVRKPHREYFKKLKAIMLEHCGPNVTFIFIDDVKANIDAAKAEGFVAIHCTDPSQLNHQLRALGVQI